MTAMHGVAAAAAAVDQSTAEPAASTMSATLLDRHEPVQRYPAVYDLCLKLLENVQHRFGEHSQQVGLSLDVLGEFKAGKIPKHQAYNTVVEQLGDDEDLKQQLYAVLQHEDARWDPDDFQGQVPPTPEPPVFPGFLQPEHHPQLPMPSISSLWGPEMYSQPIQPPVPSMNPALLRSLSQMIPRGMDHCSMSHPPVVTQSSEDNMHANRPATQGQVPYGFNGLPSPRFNPIPSSPTLALRNPFSGYDHYPSPSAIQTPTYSPYERFALGLSPIQGAGGFQTHRPSFHTENWNGHNLGFEGSLAVDRPRAERSGSQYSSPALTLQESPLRSISPRYNFAGQSPSILGTPIAMPLGQPSLDMPPPTKQSLNKKAKNESEVNRGSATDKSTPLPSKQRIGQGERVFIHSICNKGFTTRNGVKKHHWGSKTEDLSTTTGCWYKNGKPDVAWDEHTSCKAQAIQSRASKLGKSLRTSDLNGVAHHNSNAPWDPSVVARQQDTLPGFPTLQDLPHKVAESLQATPPLPTLPSSTTARPLYHFPQPPSPVGRANLDTLLTAVNVASEIEAPTPQFQGRNDSVISHLDAQVTAAESKRYSRPSWPEYNHEHERVLSSYTFSEPVVRAPFPSVGLGITSAINDDSTAQTLDPAQQRLQPVASAPSGVPATVSTNMTPRELEQGEEETTIYHAADATITAKSRRRAPRSSISKRELQMLMGSSPGPEKKRPKV